MIYRAFRWLFGFSGWLLGGFLLVHVKRVCDILISRVWDASCYLLIRSLSKVRVEVIVMLDLDAIICTLLVPQMLHIEVNAQLS